MDNGLPQGWCLRCDHREAMEPRRQLWVVLDIYGFWDDPNESPAQVVGVYLTQASALAGASDHYVAEMEGPAPDWTHGVDRRGLTLCKGEGGPMWYRIEPGALRLAKEHRQTEGTPHE